MPVRTLVTEGFGNGTFNGTIPLVVTHGYSIGAAVVVPPYVPLLTPVRTSIPTGVIRKYIEANCMKVLGTIAAKNLFVGEVPPLTTWEAWRTFLQVPSRLLQPQLEAWFITRPSIVHPEIGTETQYIQQHNIRITGLAWHNTYYDSRLYIQQQTMLLNRTLERNKDLVFRGGAELTNPVSTFRFAPFGEVQLYQSVTDFTVSLLMIEPSGRNS